MAGVYGGYWVSYELPPPPPWAFQRRSSPPRAAIKGIEKEHLFVLSGAISSEWTQIDNGVCQIFYAMLAAHNLDRPNGTPIADAVLSSHRTFQGKVELLRKISSVVLVRQPLLLDWLLEVLGKADGLADHRNAVIHGYITNASFEENSENRISGLFIAEADGANKFRAFMKKTDKPINFEKTKTRHYNRHDLGGLLAAIGQVSDELFRLQIDPYIRGLAEGTILPSQNGNLVDKSGAPHTPEID